MPPSALSRHRTQEDFAMFRSAGSRFDRIATVRRAALLLIMLLLVLLIGTSAQAAETPDGGVLGRGTAWETRYFVQTSDRAGPTVVISGGVHGDEPAGAAAAEQIRHWPIVRGMLVVLPSANPPALAARTRRIPGAPASQNNLNRNFPRAGQLDAPPLGEQAAAIWQWLQSVQPTWVVDLHEGYGIRAAGSKSVGSSVVVCPDEEADEAVERMLAAVNATIEREDKHFVRLSPPVDGSLARAAAEHLNAKAMILETSTRDLPVAATNSKAQAKSAAAKSSIVHQPLSRRVRQHRLLVHALLVHLEMIDAALDVDRIAGRAAQPGKTWVALYDAGGTGGQGVPAVSRILGDEGMRVVPLGAEEIAAGSLAEFDVVVFPGGSGSKQAAAIGEQGREQLRQFLERGGGYLGICAGAYLCTSGFDWGLKVLDAKTVSPKWQRGVGMLQMELTPAGRDVLGDHPASLEVRYHNGPVITRAELDAVPDYEVWAYYRTEVAKNNSPAGVMVDSPAIAAGRFGRGRVLFVSPHPEQSPGLEGLVRRGVRWAAGRTEQDAR
jgi:putative intracellular protease/amidase